MPANRWAPGPLQRGQKNAPFSQPSQAHDPFGHRRMRRAANSGDAAGLAKLIAAGFDPRPLLSPEEDPLHPRPTDPHASEPEAPPCILLAMAQTNFRGAAAIWERMGRADRARKLIPLLRLARSGCELPDLQAYAAQAHGLGIGAEQARAALQTLRREPLAYGCDKNFAALLGLIDPAACVFELGQDALMLAASRISDHDPCAIFPELIAACGLDAVDGQGRGALMIATQSDKPQLCRRMILAGAPSRNEAHAFARTMPAKLLSSREPIAATIRKAIAERESMEIRAAAGAPRGPRSSGAPSL